MAQKYILAIDQGTTSSRAILFNPNAEIIAQKNFEFTQIYPRPGWVEHNPEEIWQTVLKAFQYIIDESGIKYQDIDSIGITNQRETTVIWDRKTGKPIHNAIVWQCRRTADRCNKIKESIYNSIIYDKTGLVTDPYFCATKIEYILSNVENAQKSAEKGDLCFGTIESWLIYKLTAGKHHVSDYSNASRTMLLNIHTLDWDSELLEYFNIPISMMPQLISNSANNIFADPSYFGGHKIPISGVVGDQQGALFGQACFNKGDVKNTYGTGCFLLMNIGKKPRKSNNRLLTTIAWHINNEVTYAMEGAVFIGGAVIQWLRDGLGIIDNSSKTSDIAKSNTKESVLFVPAFTGLGSPYWDPDVRGSILGITRDTTRDDIVKAALEGIAYQTADLYESMKSDFGGKIGDFKADGGASKNEYLMQFQSNIIQNRVFASDMNETTALGAAFFAGLATGFFPSIDYIKGLKRTFTSYDPLINKLQSDNLYHRWKKGVESVVSFKN